MTLALGNELFNVCDKKKAESVEAFIKTGVNSKKACIPIVVHKKDEADVTYNLTSKQVDSLRLNYCEYLIPRGLLQKAEKIRALEEKRSKALKQQEDDLAKYKSKVAQEKARIEKEAKVLVDVTSKLAAIKNEIRVIEKYLGYRFHNKQLLVQAFIAKTANTKRITNSAPLEFVGDRVLYTIVTKDMSDTYLIKNDDMIKVTNMSSFSNCVTRFTTNTCFMKHIVGTPLENFMVISGAHSKKVYANLFESLIGAVALDSKYNIKKITKVYNNLMK